MHKKPIYGGRIGSFSADPPSIPDICANARSIVIYYCYLIVIPAALRRESMFLMDAGQGHSGKMPGCRTISDRKNRYILIYSLILFG
jgi:hypothetical protein